MEFKKVDDITIEGARIVFRNFSGEPDKYNKAGSRSFALVLSDHNLASKLMEDGWNVHQFKTRDEDDVPDYYLPVAVSFDYYPPNVILLSKKKREDLNESTVGILDRLDISNVDLRIRPYCWEVNGKTGIKAYLKDMYVTLNEDPLAEKYARMDDDEPMPF